MRSAAALLLGLFCWSSATAAEELRRATVWDLKLGMPVSAQPASDQFRGFACGSNGGAPRRQLSGWGDFLRCDAEANGLREVYFEYDDEYEYIARARDLPREISRWAGTTEVGFPVIVSALFDDGWRAQGIRVVTDSAARVPHRHHRCQSAQARGRLSVRRRHGRALTASSRRATACRCRQPKARAPSASCSSSRSCELIDASRGRRVVAARQLFPQDRSERRQSATTDATDPGSVRKLGSAGHQRQPAVIVRDTIPANNLHYA